MRRLERLFGILVVLTGCGVAYEGLQLGYGSDGVPGSGFFPFWVGLLLIGSGIAMVVAVKAQPDPDDQVERGQLAGLAGTAVYIGLITLAGALLATFAYLFAAINLSRRHGIVAAAATGAAATALIYFSFRVWLQIPLPRGLLFVGG